jgi:uncharacterized protein
LARTSHLYFLLTSDDLSHWHRILSDELWHFIEGDPLELHVADPSLDRVVTRRLGPFDKICEPALVVEAGFWQAGRSTGDYTFAACTVGPGFDFADFEMLKDLEIEATLRLNHPRFAAFL